MENTDLGFDIDQIKTAKQVRNFLKYDFASYLLKAGYHRTDLGSPQLNLTGISAHAGNAAESKMMRIFDMQNRCKAIYQAMEHCFNSPSHPYSTILKSLYIDELKDWQVANLIGYSDSRYDDLKRYALCQFADTIEPWQVVYDVDFPELKIWKNQNRGKVGEKSGESRG